LEERVMDVLWRADGPLSARVVLNQLTDKQLAYTTVATVLGHLVDKGLVERVSTSARPWSYRARVGSGEYSGSVMRRALVDSSDRASSFLHFLDGMSEADRAMLREILDAESGGAEHPDGRS
jgi:predicted transcriptional regulator